MAAENANSIYRWMACQRKCCSKASTNTSPMAVAVADKRHQNPDTYRPRYRGNSVDVLVNEGDTVEAASQC